MRRPPRNHLPRPVALGLLLALCLGLWATPAGAHGEGIPRLSGAQVGPYRIYVWTDPEVAQVGREWHLTVALVKPIAGQRDQEEPVLGAQILVRLTEAGSDTEPVLLEATHDQALNKLFYEAQTALPRSGTWQVDLQVVGKEGEGEIAFPIQVDPPDRTAQWRLGGTIVLLVTVVGLLAWAYRRSPGRQTE